LMDMLATELSMSRENMFACCAAALVNTGSTMILGLFETFSNWMMRLLVQLVTTTWVAIGLTDELPLVLLIFCAYVIVVIGAWISILAAVLGYEGPEYYFASIIVEAKKDQIFSIPFMLVWISSASGLVYYLTKKAFNIHYGDKHEKEHMLSPTIPVKGE